MTSCALQQAHASVSALSHQPLCGCGSSAPCKIPEYPYRPGSGYGFSPAVSFALSSHRERVVAQHTRPLSRTGRRLGCRLVTPCTFRSPFLRSHIRLPRHHDSETRANLYDGLQDATTVLGEFGRMACGEVTSSIRGMAYGVVHQIVNIKTYIASNIVGGLQVQHPLRSEPPHAASQSPLHLLPAAQRSRQWSKVGRPRRRWLKTSSRVMPPRRPVEMLGGYEHTFVSVQP